MKRRDFLQGLSSVIASSIVSGCGYSYFSQKLQCMEPADEMTDSKKVLLIGIDGMRPDALEAARTPNLDYLRKNGCYTNKACAGSETVSGPGWSNILTGVWENKHGVTDNFFGSKNYQQYPSLFTRLHYMRPELCTASIVSWEPLHKYLIPYADYRILRGPVGKTDHLITQAVAHIFQQHCAPDMTFLYYGAVDLTGHSRGFSPSVPAYIKSIENTDKFIGHVLDTILQRPTYWQEDWLILCTTDHGGSAYHHAPYLDINRRIFYIASGNAAIHGDLFTPVTQVDVVPTILDFLDIPIDPAWNLDGRSVGLRKNLPHV